MDDVAILREIARRIRAGIDDPAAAPAASDKAVRPSSPHQQDVLARLAHELRTPISAITAAAEVMAAQRLGPIDNATYRDYAENIAVSGRHALTIIDRVLHDWPQPAEALPLEFAQLDLNRMMARLAAVLQPLARDRGQTIETRLQERLPHVIADATSLRQIVLNLVTNAIKYAAADGTITLSTRSVLDGPVILVVSDTGPGMTPEQLAAASGAIDVDASSHRGTGLGLPLVRALAAANGADFSIASAPGSPTVATLSFAKDKVVPV